MNPNKLQQDRLSYLANQVYDLKESTERKIDTKFTQIEGVLGDVKEVKEEVKVLAERTQNTLSEIDNKFEEHTNEVVEIIKEIKETGLKGDKGDDADEEAIEERLLAKIPKLEEIIKTFPTEQEIAEKVIKLIPESKPSLKIIQENIDIEAVTEKVKDELDLDKIKKDLQKEVKLEVSRNKGYQVSGGGFNNIYNGSTLVSSGLTGLSFTGAGVSSIAQSGGIVTVTIAGGGSGSPGGSDTQLQYNNAGAFGGITGATTNGTVVTLTSPVIATSQTNSYATASTIGIFDGSKNLISADTATYPSLTELSYVKGVTSSIQTQLNAKGTGTVTSVSFTGGIISVATATTTPALTVAGTSGGIPYFSSASTWASSAALAANALVIGGGAGVAPSTTTTGTGVLTALGTNVGSAGAFVVFDGALGTPSSGTVTNLTGTASININGTVGATTPAAGTFTTLTVNTSLTMADAANVIINTTTGTKFGTATTQKLAFYNSTPIIQPTGDVATALQNLGLVASATVNSTTITVANEATDTTCFPLFVTAATGDLAPKSNTNLTFNSNTGSLGATLMTATTSVTSASILASSNDSGALGASGTAFSDLFLASGGVVNWNAGDVTITHSANTLAFAGATSGYTFDDEILPSANDGAGLGAPTVSWSDLFLASGGVISFANNNYVLTHSSGLLTASGAFSVGTSNAITAGTIELGAASDTTIARSSAGQISVEGVQVVTTSNTVTLTNKIISHTIEPGTDDTYTGDNMTGILAGDTIAQWDLVYLDSTSGRWEFADADAATTAGGVMLALASAAGTDGNALTVVTQGVVRNDGWTWTGAGKPLYVSTTAGGMTETAPSGTDDVVRIVGYTLSDDCIYFSPSNDWITRV